MPKGVYVRSPEHLARLTEQARQINQGGLSDQHRARLRAAWRNRTDTPWNKGQKTGPLTADHRAKIGAANIGREVSEQCRQASSRALTTHGHTRQHRPTTTYTCWCAMHRRCFAVNSKDYPAYGGRGITVCDRWRRFENFFADMGERPPGLSIDRFPNNDGNYEPSNVRWATPKEQANNRRKARR